MHDNHMLVWIDHHEAKLFEIRRQPVDSVVVHDGGPLHHVHTKRDHVERARSADEHFFMQAIAAALADSAAILIVGPGQARTELASFLEKRFPLISQNVWAVEAMDHPTDPELVAYGHTYFHREERMRIGWLDKQIMDS